MMCESTVSPPPESRAAALDTPQISIFWYLQKCHMLTATAEDFSLSLSTCETYYGLEMKKNVWNNDIST